MVRNQLPAQVVKDYQLTTCNIYGREIKVQEKS